MVRLALALVLAVGCGFTPSGLAPEDGDGSVTDTAPNPDGTPPPSVDAATTDAATPTPIDAPTVFDPATCPGNYGDQVGVSRYRRIGNDGDVLAHNADCNDDSDGLTHLFVPSNASEVDLLRGRLCPGASCRQHWVGVYALDGVNYISVTGETPFLRWDNGQPGDFDTPPTAVEFNAGDDAMIDLFMFQGARFPAICECDGRAPSALPTL